MRWLTWRLIHRLSMQAHKKRVGCLVIRTFLKPRQSLAPRDRLAALSAPKSPLFVWQVPPAAP